MKHIFRVLAPAKSVWEFAILLFVVPFAYGAPLTIPGGIFVLPLPAGTTGVIYQEKPVFTIDSHAIVPIPISTKPGVQELWLERADGKQPVSFRVVDHQYTEQHITIQNNALVSPPQEVQDRITNEALRQRKLYACLLYTSPSPRDREKSRMPSSA